MILTKYNNFAHLQPYLPAFGVDIIGLMTHGTLLHTQEAAGSKPAAPTKTTNKIKTFAERFEAKVAAFRARQGQKAIEFAHPQPNRNPNELRPALARARFTNQYSGKPEILNERPPFPDSRYVPLTKGKRAIVSEQDYDRVMLFSWRAKMNFGNWYAIRGTDGETQMHRIITDAKKGERIDHWNGDGLDNRRENLRRCSNAQNLRNSKVYARKTTAKLKGVYFDKSNGKFRAQIMCQYKKINLGNFTDEESAGRAYDTAARKLFGEFARLNFPEVSNA